MKNIFTFIILLVLTSCLYGQNVSPSVVAAHGNYADDGTNNIAWTIGEIAVSTISSSNYIITQGFHQPEVVPDQVIELSEDKKIKVFPNPVSDLLNIDIKITQGARYQLQLTDIIGNLITGKKIENSLSKLNFKSLSDGIYILKISDLNSKNCYSFRIIKSS